MSTNTEVQTRPNADETAIPDVTRELLVKYLDTFGLAAELTDEEKEQFIQVATAYQLDPFRREIHAVPYGQGEYRKLSLIVGYEVYLKRAENTGRLNGWAVWTEGSGDEMKAVVEIHRKDWATPFRHEVPWLEAAQYNREGKLTAFWRRMPKFQLKKVAISQGFRLAFPDDLGGLPYDASELPPEMSTERDVTPKASESDPESPQQRPTEPAKPLVIGVPRDNPKNGKPNRRLEALHKRLADHEHCFSDNHLAWVRKQLEDDASDTNLARIEKHVDEVIKRKQVTEPLGRVRDRVTARETEALRDREPAPIF